MIKILKQYYDLILFVPTSIILLLLMFFGIHQIDGTAALLDLGNLQLLTFNVLNYCLVNGLGYLFFRLNLGYDPFYSGWLIGMPKLQQALLTVFLFIFQMLLAFYMLSKNL